MLKVLAFTLALWATYPYHQDETFLSRDCGFFANIAKDIGKLLHEGTVEAGKHGLAAWPCRMQDGGGVPEGWHALDSEEQDQSEC